MFTKLSSFLGESRQELTRVNWPTREETIRLTIVVIGISLLVAALLGSFDAFFTYLLQLIVLR
ncbi:preprotein translocase subunit SecE [Patescibacteria group bacterium]|nr:preprotein translocase subunit SecE [Patescibacteria group bacterium]